MNLSPSERNEYIYNYVIFRAAVWANSYTTATSTSTNTQINKALQLEICLHSEFTSYVGCAVAFVKYVSSQIRDFCSCKYVKKKSITRNESKWVIVYSVWLLNILLASLVRPYSETIMQIFQILLFYRSRCAGTAIESITLVTFIDPLPSLWQTNAAYPLYKKKSEKQKERHPIFWYHRGWNKILLREIDRRNKIKDLIQSKLEKSENPAKIHRACSARIHICD